MKINIVKFEDGLTAKKTTLGDVQDALEQAPDDPERWFDLGNAYDHLEKYENAKACFLRAIDLRPDVADYWGRLGNILNELQDLEGALMAHRESARLKPDNPIFCGNVGVIAMELGRYDEAEKALTKATIIDPDRAEPWFELGLLHFNNLGVTYADLGNCEKAIKAYRKALHFQPDNLTSLGNLLNAYQVTGQQVKAASISRRIVGQTLKTYSSEIIEHSTRPKLFSATVDLKLTTGGGIKILEFNNLWQSGFKGFEQVTGKNMIQDIVQPFYDALLKQWQSQGFPIEKIETVDLKKAPDLLCFFAFARKKQDQNIVANADPGFLALCRYKDYLNAIMPNELEVYVPRTAVTPLSSNEHAFPALDGRIVIKPSDSFQGKGVEIIEAGQAKEKVGGIASVYKNQGQTNISYWDDSNIHPNILLQECLNSVPVPAQDGLLYDGTMRVAFTAILNPGDEVPEIHFHGAYWKLPPAPYAPEGNADSIVSFAPCHLKGDIKAAFNQKPFAAAVSDEHRAITEAQLRDFLQRLLPHAIAPVNPFLERVKGMMGSSQEWVRALGTRLATDHSFGNMLMREGGREAIRELVDKMSVNCRQHKDDGAVLYLRQIFAAASGRLRSNREACFYADTAEYVRVARGLRQLAMAG
jgi:tetratricopeptide (TPR) repeat protein